MDRDNIRKMVAEEIARPEIRKALDRPGRLQQLLKLFQSPAFITLLTFVLSTVVGTVITQQISDRSKRAGELDNALEAVRSFASEASELRVQQGFFLEVMERKASEADLTRAKEKYDESYLDWHATRYRNYLTIRSFFGFTYENFAEQLVSRTIHRDFRAFNTCLDQVYDSRLEGGDARDKMNICLAGEARQAPPNEQDTDNFDHWQSKIFQCSRQIFDTLHHFIAKDIHCGRSAWTETDTAGKTRVEKIYEQTWADCGTGKMPVFQSFGTDAPLFCTISDGGLW